VIGDVLAVLLLIGLMFLPLWCAIACVLLFGMFGWMGSIDSQG
jgi:hypothetical protein